MITAFEKIKHDLGERLRKPGVVDRDALSAWLKAAKMDVAGEPKVEFRPVEGCSSEELSKVSRFCHRPHSLAAPKVAWTVLLAS